MLSVIAATGLEVAINQALALSLDQYQDEAGRQRLQSFDGKVIAIELRGLNIQFYFIFNDQTVYVQSQLQGRADTVIAATPLSLVRMKVVAKQQQMLFSGDVSISGDVALGQQFSSLLNDLNIDWEEHLSHFLGDVVAHEVARQVQNLSDWARHSMATLGQNSTEYLHEELRLLVPDIEQQVFLSAVDEFRDDLARLEKRLEKMQWQRESSSS